MVGATLLAIGAIAVFGDAALGCTARTGYCAGWSAAGLVGVLLFLAGLVVTAVAYRARRSSVVEWSDEMARSTAENAGAPADPENPPPRG